jgi:3-keto-5-aminohexanoate cleavage enzyme
MGKLIIEARVNEYMMRAQGNPHVPYLPEEIVADALACRKAGASIVHSMRASPTAVRITM